MKTNQLRWGVWIIELTTDRTSSEIGVLDQAVLLSICSRVAKIIKKYLWMNLILVNLQDDILQLYQKIKFLLAFSGCLFTDAGQGWLSVNSYVKLLHH